MWGTMRNEEPEEKVQQYLDSLPNRAREALHEVRQIIAASAPGATESFGYGMPAFAIHGKSFIWYAAWKEHCSIYPVSEATRSALAKELHACELSGKSTARFRLDRPLPVALVRALVEARLGEVQARKR
jgi:uncharacterized protein YdhG (YjbR/CyaY superfamily)